jgi:type II secretory pathway pseudopilin PulG
MKAANGERRSGFTLMQLLVVLAVLIFLAGMLLPGVAQMRQMAMRTQALNNLKQLGLAIHNCNSTYGRLPPTVGKFPNDKSEGTLFFYLLPFVEQDEIYRNAQGNVWHGGTAAKVVKVFLNPADASGPPDHVYRGALATSSFAANWMAFGTKGARIPATFPDGTSNTIAFGERYQMCNGQPNAWGYHGLYYWTPTFMRYSEAHFQVAPDANTKECDVRLAQSPFRDGMCAGIADGSARLLGRNLSDLTYYLACNPADGQPLGTDWND